MKAIEVVSVLEQNNFVLISQRGSHQKWRNQETGKQVIVPSHKGKELPFGTLKSIMDGSGIPAVKFKT
ncbi:MAG TPA: type II toxin-antitoxin system HicA family toxin [Dehalococcoidales bacterium]|nr:type II toxin-antitoxin system HicA family toxin [Dehalococcoidales bacterium]